MKKLLRTKTWILPLALIALLGACSRDRDLDSYNRDRMRDKLAELEPVEGTYMGELKDRKNGRSWGTLIVQLQADTGVQNFAEQVPLLKGRVSFNSGQPIDLIFRESYFDPDTGRFQSVLKIGGAEGTPREIVLKAQADDDELRGTLASFGYEDQGGRFQLKRYRNLSDQSRFLRVLNARTRPEPNLQLVRRVYKGSARLDATSPPLEVEMTIDNQTLLPEEHFADLLSPKKKVRVTLTLHGPSSAHADASFDNSRWEPRYGLLEARRESSMLQNRARWSLDCAPVDSRAPEGTLSCRYQSTERAILMRFEMRPEES